MRQEMSPNCETQDRELLISVDILWCVRIAFKPPIFRESGLAQYGWY